MSDDASGDADARAQAHWDTFIYRSNARHWNSLWCRYSPAGELKMKFNAERIFTPLESTSGCKMQVIYHYEDERGTVAEGPACGPWDITAEHSLADGLTHPAQPTSMTTLLLPAGGVSAWCMKQSPEGAPCATEMFLHHGDALRMSAGVIHAKDSGELQQLSLIREDTRAPSSAWQQQPSPRFGTGVDATLSSAPALAELLAKLGAPTSARGTGCAITADLRQRTLSEEEWTATRVASARADEDVLLLCGDENVAIVAPANKGKGTPFSSAAAWWPTTTTADGSEVRALYTIEVRWDASGALEEVRYCTFGGTV